jgi:hypothetical protein
MKLSNSVQCALAALVCLLTCSACSHMQLGTLWSMRNVDFVTVDPGVIRIALALPEGARLSSVALELEFTRQSENLFEDRIELDLLTSGAELGQPGLPRPIGNIVVLRVPGSRAADVRKLRNLYLAERSEPKGASASFGIDASLDQDWIKKYCEEETKSLEISAWIMVDRQQGYLPLMKDSEVTKMLAIQSSGICT